MDFILHTNTKFKKFHKMRGSFTISAIMAITAITMMTSCTDPVHNGDPADTSYGTSFPLDEFHKLGEAGDTLAQRRLVEDYRRQLTINVVNHYPNIQDEKNIKFILGSGYAKNVLTGSGKTNSGKFKNELIIIIDDPTVKDTVFLACGNGMLSPLRFREYHDLGNAEQWRFSIQKGEGLAHHLPTLQQWAKVAGDLSIPIKNKDGNVVSKTTYLNYLGRYESLLFTGDIVDVINGKVYNKAGQEVDFDRRQAETKKANAKAKAEAEAKAKALAKAKSKAKSKRR